MKKFDWNDYLFTKEERDIIKNKVRTVTDKYFDGVNGLIRLRNNNKGIALITIIIVIAVLSILVTTLANVSIFSFQRKAADYQAKDTFYDAEGALDDIRVGLQSAVGANLDKITDSDAYTAGVKNSLDTGASANGSMAQYLYSLVSNDYKAEGTQLDITVGSVKIEDKSVLIDDITVAYTDESGYYSKIGTDIRIEAPSVTLTEPVGSYSTIAGSGMVMDFGNTNNGDYKNSAYANFTGSIYIGYEEDIEDVATDYPFETDYTKWKAVELQDRATMTYSGKTVKINGNIYLGTGSTLRLEGNTVDVYGGIIMEPGAVLIIDETTKLTCYGIYTVDANGNNIQEYTGNIDAALATIEDSNSTESTPIYSGHIPYTYPFVYDFNYYYIMQKGSISAAYGNLDLDRFEVPSQLNFAKLTDDRSICCYASPDGTIKPMSDASGNNNKICTMQQNLTEATVLIGVKCDEENNYPIYDYADEFTYTVYYNGNNKGTFTPDCANGYKATYTGTNQATASAYDYSGIAYPVSLSGTVATEYIYGDTSKNHVGTKDVSECIVIDKSHTPQPKVESDYDYYNTNKSSSFCKYFDAVVYSFCEIDWPAMGDLNRNSVKTSKVNGEEVQSYVGNSDQPINASDETMLAISNSQITIKASTPYLRALSFTSKNVKMETQNSIMIIQSFIKEDEIEAIDKYTTAYAAATGTDEEKEKAAKAQYPLGYQLKTDYDTWGETHYQVTDVPSYYDYKSTFRDNLGVNFTANNGGFTDEVWLQALQKLGVTNSDGSAVTTETLAEHEIMLSDFFKKGGIECLYASQNNINAAKIKNSTSFSVITMENWERE